MLATIIAAVVFIGIVIAAMAVGVIFSNKPIKGSCGGLANVGITGECEICGGNIDVRLLSGVLNRQLVRDGRMVRLRIDIIDRPGVLAKLTEVIGRTSGNIIEVQHQRLFYDVPVKQAEIDIIVETHNASHVQEIVDALKAAGFSSRVLSNRALDANS